MTRTSWCGQVAAPKASLSLAWPRRLDARPSAPPMTKETAGRSSARHSRNVPASAALSSEVPRSSRMTMTARSGITLAMAMDSSVRRRSASAARLSRISTISMSRRPNARPTFSARLQYSAASSRSGPCLRRPTAAMTMRMRVRVLDRFPGAAQHEAKRSDALQTRDRYGRRVRGDPGSAVHRHSASKDARKRAYGAAPRPGNEARDLACALCRPAGHPHLLEIVEGADFGPEDVNDHVARIDQHPVALRRAFDAGRNAGFVQILDHPVGDRADMALRPAGRYDHVVADRGFIAKIDGEDVLGLHVVEAGEDQTEDLLCVKTHSGDRFGHATFVPRDYNCGQGCLSFRSKLPAPATESGARLKIGTPG